MQNSGWQPGMTLADVERAVILHAYRHFRGNKTQTAEALGITVKTIYNKLEVYGLKEVKMENRRPGEDANVLVPAKELESKMETGYRGPQREDFERDAHGALDLPMSVIASPPKDPTIKKDQPIKQASGGKR